MVICSHKLTIFDELQNTKNIKRKTIGDRKRLESFKVDYFHSNPSAPSTYNLYYWE